MKTMNAVALLAVLGSPAMADQQARARELLAMWQPQSVAIDGGVLTVVLPQNRISEEIYMAVLTSGLCLGFAMDKPLNGLSGIEVLNRHGRQGYVLEHGLAPCKTWNGRPVGSKTTY
ncbi:hypothetical protein [Antarctobacter sp.]|uniref:hypothetical protein n=1 Tax=Antarctobacter sp. TaxID=1872577 RepID=UPI003A91C85E